VTRYTKAQDGRILEKGHDCGRGGSMRPWVDFRTLQRSIATEQLSKLAVGRSTGQLRLSWTTTYHE